jgi:antitoxin PrlF
MMTTLTSKGQITLPKPLRDRLGLKAGAQVDFVVNTSGEIVLKPAQKALTNAAKAYRAALISVSGSADKRFATTDEFMRFVRG